MKNIKKITNAINYRFLACIFVVTVGASLMSGIAFAQSVATDTLDVTATVNAGQSSLTINETTVGFGSVTPSQAGSRFESANVTGDYFAANGPWELLVYTTNANDTEGLIGTGNVAPNDNLGALLPFRVDPGADHDVTDNSHWAGSADMFTPVPDDGSPNPAVIASSANGDPGNQPNLLFNFGIDVAGAHQGPYSVTVTAELAIL